MTSAAAAKNPSGSMKNRGSGERAEVTSRRRGPRPATWEEALATRVRITDSGCWEWCGSRQSGGGYGIFRNSRREPLVYAHRESYEQHFGPIPEGMVVRHRCDNPPCVNPLHLLIGTHFDNHWDAQRRGRSVMPPGSKMRFTPDDIRAIRSRRAAGEGLRRIGLDYGVAECSVWDIVNRKTWAHVED